jgi:two-component system cell cycle sensor histidine kinase/response regulator CckA
MAGLSESIYASYIHGLNNILFVSLGYLQTMFHSEKIPPSAYDKLRKIEDLLSNAIKTNKKILKLQRERIPEVIDLNQTINDMKNLLKFLTGSQIEINYRLTENIPGIRIFSGEVEQILLNLVVNARDAIGEEKGTVIIQTGIEDIRQKQYAFLEVSDTGCGMDSEIQKQIFKPYFTTKNGNHSGLGLSFVRSIVERCGGMINVKSKPGKGTTFKILFPVLEQNFSQSDKEVACE